MVNTLGFENRIVYFIAMGTDVLKSYDSLQRELERAKNNLKGLNDNIRRIIGRDPQDNILRGDRKRSFNDNRRNEFTSVDRQRNRERDVSPVPLKRRPQETKSVFSRLSGPPIRDDDVKPKIHSRVIRELPTRQEIVAAQGVDEESRARNRRMFGCLLGTLQKFCQEESRLKEKEEMKAQIEKKLEEQQIQERENLKKERQSLFSDRKRQQLEIRKLELKMTRLREFEVWEKAKKDLKDFIKTKAKPQIYYRPKMMNDSLEKKLATCQSELEQEIEKKRTEVNEEILTIENRFKVREEHILVKVEKSQPTKHDRRNENDEDDEDDDHDSIYGNSDDDHVENHEEQEESKSHEQNQGKDQEEFKDSEVNKNKLSHTEEGNSKNEEINKVKEKNGEMRETE